MIALISFLVATAVSLLIAGVLRLRTPGYEGQLLRYREEKNTPVQVTRYERWVRPVALWLALEFPLLRGPANLKKVAQQLDYAGNPRGITADELYGLQLLGALVGLLAGAYALVLRLPLSVVIATVCCAAGSYAPRLWLRSRVRRRQQAISTNLPDLLDMLAVCVSAGLGFDTALRMLADRGDGPLYEEVHRLLREIQIGEPRKQAFNTLVARNSSEPLRSFVGALLQAEELGTSITDVLERQAESLRIYRRHSAQKRASLANNLTTLIVSTLR